MFDGHYRKRLGDDLPRWRERGWVTADGAASILASLDADARPGKFFVPEGEGRDLEKLRNDRRIQVDVAVADDGRAMLKRLRVDGAVRYEEKMF